VKRGISPAYFWRPRFWLLSVGLPITSVKSLDWAEMRLTFDLHNWLISPSVASNRHSDGSLVPGRAMM